MASVKYVGPYDAVEIAATGQVVERGKSVEIEDDDLAKSLTKQEGAWETPKSTKKGDS